MLNVELLLKVRDHIIRNPLQLDMSTFWDRDACGTVGCIAGWTVAIGYGRHVADHIFDNGDPATEGIPERACCLLGIHEYQSTPLFYVKHWPLDLRSEYFRFRLDESLSESEPLDAQFASLIADLTARRIDRFIAEHGPSVSYIGGKELVLV